MGREISHRSDGRRLPGRAVVGVLLGVVRCVLGKLVEVMGKRTHRLEAAPLERATGRPDPELKALGRGGTRDPPPARMTPAAAAAEILFSCLSSSYCLLAVRAAIRSVSPPPSTEPPPAGISRLGPMRNNDRARDGPSPSRDALGCGFRYAPRTRSRRTVNGMADSMASCSMMKESEKAPAPPAPGASARTLVGAQITKLHSTSKVVPSDVL